LKIKASKKRAVSELMGTLLMVTITLVAGAAVFGWINSQASTSETAYGQSVANNVDFLQERFALVTQSFSLNGVACSGGTAPNYQCNQLSFWVYNSGAVVFTLYTVRIQNLTDIPSSAANKNPLNIVFYAGSASGCSSNPQTCGFIAYNKAGTSQVCSDAAAWSTTNDQPGFYQNGGLPTQLPQSQLTSNPYMITMPTAATCTGSGGGAQYLYDGITYTLTFTGLYGNAVPTTVTVNG